MAPKERLQESEAKQTVARASKAFFELLERGGIKLEEGCPDAAGRPFTTVSIEELRREVRHAMWQSLKQDYLIEEDSPDDEPDSAP